MSKFVSSIDTFSEQYHLSLVHKLKLLLHFPLFKMYWLSLYGKGFLQQMSQTIYPLFKDYKINISLQDKSKEMFKLDVSFEKYDLESFREIFLGGEYKEILKNPNIKTVFDIGANTGMAAIFFKMNMSLDKLVVVEANPMLSKRLDSIFSDKKIIIENLAVFGERGSLRFKVSENHRESAIFDPSIHNENESNVVSVDTVLLEDLLTKHSISDADLLKMDIEGAEYSIIEKTPDAFQKFKFLYIEIHGEEAKRYIFRDKIISLGFKISNPNRARLDNCETCLFERNF